jgi:rhodanese-related sulfurtransferase
MTVSTLDQRPAGGQPSSRAPNGLIEAAPKQVSEWLSAGQAVLIDVREPDEHARERIPGARLIPLSRYSVAEVLGHATGQKIVVHCRSGSRGAEACRITLSGAGDREVFNLSGGIEAWKAAGLPVQVNTAVSRISVIRQVQLVIGACVLIGAGLTWLVHPAFLVIPAFFGAGLLFAGATGTCALATVIGWLPWNRISPRS